MEKIVTSTCIGTLNSCKPMKPKKGAHFQMTSGMVQQHGYYYYYYLGVTTSGLAVTSC